MYSSSCRRPCCRPLASPLAAPRRSGRSPGRAIACTCIREHGVPIRFLGPASPFHSSTTSRVFPESGREQTRLTPSTSHVRCIAYGRIVCQHVWQCHTIWTHARFRYSLPGAPMKEILADLDRWHEEKEEIALATLVHVRGSATRLPGARLCLTRSGRMAGCGSGGCVESDSFERAREVRDGGRPAVATDGLAHHRPCAVGLGTHGTWRGRKQQSPGFGSGPSPKWTMPARSMSWATPCTMSEGTTKRSRLTHSRLKPTRDSRTPTPILA